MYEDHVSPYLHFKRVCRREELLYLERHCDVGSDVEVSI